MESCDISIDFIDDFKKAIDCLTVTEASYRNIDTNTNKVLEDIMRAMDTYSLVDMPTGNVEIKQQIESFQQFYVNKSQRKRKDEWSTKALRIRFLATLAGRLSAGNISNSEVVEHILKCRNIEQNLNKVTGDAVQKLRKEILYLAQTKILHFKDLKGKPLPRVFWQILTVENIEDIKSLIEN